MDTRTNNNISVIKIIYMFILPTTTFIMLLVVSSFNQRKEILGSVFFDLLVRLFLTIWFCALYIRLSRITEYGIYPNIRWSKSDVKSNEKYIYQGMVISFGIGCAVITWWVVKSFLPAFQDIGFLIAGLNGVLIMFPLLKNYWVLKF